MEAIYTTHSWPQLQPTNSYRLARDFDALQNFDNMGLVQVKTRKLFRRRNERAWPPWPDTQCWTAVGLRGAARRAFPSAMR